MSRYIDINKDEALRMRENGSSNQEIADFFGVSYSTILNKIGSVRKYRKVKKKKVDVPKVENVPKQTTVPFAGSKLKEMYEINGNIYTFDFQKRMIVMESEFSCTEIPFDKFNEYVMEIIQIGQVLNEILSNERITEIK